MTWHLTTKSIRRQHHLRVPMSCREVLIIARTCHGLNRICVESGMFVTYNVEFRKTDFTFSFFPKQNGICMGRRKRQLVFVGTLSSDRVGIVFFGWLCALSPSNPKKKNRRHKDITNSIDASKGLTPSKTATTTTTTTTIGKETTDCCHESL